MNEQEFTWRKMTSEEQDQFDPEGVHAFCETFAQMEDYWGAVRIAVDEYTVYLEFALPIQRPDEPDALLAIRDHSMGVDGAKAWVERNLPSMIWCRQLVDAGFRTEII